jgi:hypothetical protein
MQSGRVRNSALRLSDGSGVARSDGVHEEIERELRAEAAVAISPRSNLFLPYFDTKRASKWAAALEYADAQDIHSKRLPAFLWRVGGVEGGGSRSG